MIFLQARQILGLEQPLKSQTRRVNFPYELAVQLWKRGWSYHPGISWTHKEWLRDFPPTDAQIAEANRILANNTITLPVQPGRGKVIGRTPPLEAIRRERLGDISDEDCLAEGVIIRCYGIEGERTFGKYQQYLCLTNHLAPQSAYACLWNHCGNWERDQERDVWALCFEREENDEES